MIDDLRALLTPHATSENRQGMEAYMRGQFQFLGVKTPDRRAATHEFLKALPKQLDREFVQACWNQPEREFAYVACDYIKKANLTHEDLSLLQLLVTTKSWWDTVDALAKPIGTIATPTDMREWARSDNMWLRRVSVIHQLGRKQDTDVELLAEMVLAANGTTEFFLNKAIGWALRDYARSNPEWVRAFLAEHGEALAPLARREASKHL